MKISIFLILFFLVSISLTGCFEEKKDNNVQDFATESDFIGMWVVIDDLSNNSLGDTYNFYEDYKLVITFAKSEDMGSSVDFYDFKVKNNQLCIKTSLNWSCFDYEFFNENKCITLLSGAMTLEKFDGYSNNPLIEFDVDETNNFLNVTHINQTTLYWDDFEVIGNANAPSGKINIGDSITNCSGNILIRYKKSNMFLGAWSFLMRADIQEIEYIIDDLEFLEVFFEEIDNVNFLNENNIIWRDDFELEPIQWVTSCNNGGNVETNISDNYYSEGHSLKILTGTDFGNSCGIYKPFYNSGYEKLNIEIAFTVDPNGFEDYKIFRIYQSSGSYEGINIGSITVDTANDNLYYTNSTNDIHLFATDISLFADEYCWHQMSLIVDFNKSEYINFTLDGSVYDLSGFKLSNPNYKSDLPVIFVEYASFSNGEGQAVSYADQFIIGNLSTT